MLRRSRRPLRQSPSRENAGEHPRAYSVHGSHLLARCHGRPHVINPNAARANHFLPPNKAGRQTTSALVQVGGVVRVMVHVLTETSRHADILREQLDGAVGAGPVATSDHDDADWEAHRLRIEKAARKASSDTCLWRPCISRRRRSSRSRFDAADHQGPALEPPWEFFLAASLVPGRVLTLPHWRQRKQRLT